MNIDLKSDELPDIVGGLFYVVDTVALPVKEALKGKGDILLGVESNRVDRQPPYVAELLRNSSPFALFRSEFSCRISRLLVLRKNQAT